MSTLKVDAIRHNSATSDAITTAADGTCTARITGMTGGGGLSHRNLVINGAMTVAQRSVSSTSSGFHTVDRFEVEYTGTDEAPTQAQVDVSAGTTPYTNGFRKAFKITNGNQTSGAGSSDRIRYRYKVESQDLANSGWNYVSSSSNVTLSFWIKSSVAQNFYGQFLTMDGTQRAYTFETGSLTADTWTKITKTITGDSNITFNNDNGLGLQFDFFAFLGTASTGTMTLNQWGNYNGSARTPDNTTTWYTTNDATLEITGVQLEVGDTATSFEHRSAAEELELCKRYYQQVFFYWNTGSTNSNYLYYVGGQFHPVMRAAPSLVAGYDNNNENSFETRDGSTWRTGLPSLISASPEGIVLRSNNNVVFNAIKGIAHFAAEL